ncbi:MAG TPA: hypothetical protein VHX61_02805 [Rhizomicrobium sp.]|jgi:hypothetical protein|nr:hypothetical protein [Rhizomicrobium sp.]
MSADANIEGNLSALIDDPDFSTIDERMARFNVFEAMGAVRGELRHSNFIAFFLLYFDRLGYAQPSISRPGPTLSIFASCPYRIRSMTSRACRPVFTPYSFGPAVSCSTVAPLSRPRRRATVAYFGLSNFMAIVLFLFSASGRAALT